MKNTGKLTAMSKIKPGSRRQKEILIQKAVKRKKTGQGLKNKRYALEKRKEVSKRSAALRELGKSVNLEAVKKYVM